MTDKDTLKPCPFCGSQPRTYWDNEGPNNKFFKEGFNILCCVVHVMAILKNEAIEAWNTRV